MGPCTRAAAAAFHSIWCTWTRLLHCLFFPYYAPMETCDSSLFRFAKQGSIQSAGGIAPCREVARVYSIQTTSLVNVLAAVAKEPWRALCGAALYLLAQCWPKHSGAIDAARPAPDVCDRGTAPSLCDLKQAILCAHGAPSGSASWGPAA
jgi:hypothetical protein